ncbi:hypothetical protein [Bradyrhizobium sp. CCBAU 11386]|uniref:hypothetical protein n=1 Tax=Bradyrhizobium sp. CCBAU 11386 TaxID=1630837 RepID=UPI002303F99A|nr:hypothetical protein [Bradyrhizobium sp. CCBAU 11386]
MSELPKTLATDAERARADAYANNLLNTPATVEVDPYVHGGAKIDWFNRSESYDDSRPGGMTGSTYRLTGGGSASLNVRDAFLVSANGGTFIAIRRSKSRLPIKGVFAETPSTALGQDGAAARKAWDRAANSELATRLPQEIQKQLLAEGLPYSAPSDND